MRLRRQDAAVLVAVSFLATPGTWAEEAGGGLVGWVENTQGVPVSGAVVSLFGRGIRGGSVVTLTDSTGQFTLPSLPAGSYTLRAISTGHQPAAARQITVLPNRESLFTVSLTPEGEDQAVAPAAAAEDAATAVSPREWRWLMRHRRRSVLEASNHASAARPGDAISATPTTADPRLADLAGSVEFLSAPLVLGSGSDASTLDSGANMGALRLGGRFEDGGTWNLGGLLAESSNTTWRMAAEFVLQPADGHRLEAGAGFGTVDFQTVPSDLQTDGLDMRSLGAIFVRDNWAASDRLTGVFGARYTFVGFLADRNYVDPSASVTVRPDRETVVRGSVGSHTLAPGGDLLTVSTIASSPALVLAQLDDQVRAERAVRVDLSADRSLGSATTVGAFSYYEDVRDQMLNAYEGDARARALRILNMGPVVVRGVGVSVTRHFGANVRSSVAYSYGHSQRDGALVEPPGAAFVPASYSSASFHDVVARVETLIDATDTRLAAYCRVNSMRAAEADPRMAHSQTLTTRFDVQLTQGLPFLQSLTRADWEVLLSVRNLSYETSEAGTLDELAVLRPPKRILGGVSVRF